MSPPATPAASRFKLALWMLIIFGIVFSALVFKQAFSLVALYFAERSLWMLIAASLVLLLGLAGKEITGSWGGVLIDSRNKYSLSRLQMSLWTIIVLSAFLAIALTRVVAVTTASAGVTQALDITFPPELILAMGISAASFAGSSLIQSSKKSRQFRIDARATPESAAERATAAQKEFDQADSDLVEKAKAETEQKAKYDAAKATYEAAKTPVNEQQMTKAETLYRKLQADKEEAVKARETKSKALQQAKDELATINEAQGLLHKNADPSEAGWVDLFRGEEIGNYRQVDMSKVQMLFFTVVVLFAYGAALFRILGDGVYVRGTTTLPFPEFSDTLTTLLGVSHATYLSVKTVDHS